MSIKMYTGFVGSGKTYHAVAECFDVANARLGNRYVISNIRLHDTKNIFKKTGKTPERWIYTPTEQITVEYLIKMSIEYEFYKKQGSCVLVIDEAGVPFNSRTQSKDPDRLTWIKFFSQSRHFGYDIILVVQDSSMLDGQVAKLCEYEVSHRVLNNWKLFSILNLFRIKIFIHLSYWNGINKRREKASVGMTIFRKSIAKKYNTMALAEKIDIETFDYESWRASNFN